VLTVTLHGTNDAAIITGSSTAELTETNAVQSTSGNLDATDVDSSNTFVVQTAVAGSNGYGTFSIDDTGAWTYTMDSAHNEFVGGTDYTDSITVATADGTTQVLTVTLHGTNDAAIITGSSTAELTETNAVQSTSGNLDATDVDSSNTFVVQTAVAGSNGYGTFSIDDTGAWTYTMDSAHNEFVGGTDYTDSITVATADGTTQVLTVTLHGTNDAAIITGSSTAELTETNAVQSTSGNLDATDVDSSNTFVVQTAVAGSNGYGTFSIDDTGAWTYTMDSAHNEFVGGTDYTDSITVATADGTTQVLTVTLHGTNDAAIITGSSTAELTETNAVQSTSGNLDATDVDSSNTFVVQTAVAGSNGYGTFSIDDTGAWTYTMDSAHNEFVGGTDYTDSITVATADGTTQVLTVTLHGTNDAAIITGSSTAELTETNAVQSTSGNLDATDVDSSNTFVVQTAVAGSNGYGTFSIDDTGAWTYTMDSAHNEFVGGTDYTDSITVATADGTTQVLTVTLHGTNDAAIITGSSTAELTETNAVQSTSGNLDATDVDSSNTFVVQTAVAGSNGYGTFSIDDTGAWTYTMDSAHNEFVGGTDYTDSITVATADGTTQVLTVTLHGTNDAAIITGSSTAELTETNAVQSTSGNLDATDVDSSNTFVVQTAVAGSNGYGTFSIDDTGAWTYTMDSAHNEFVGGTDYTDSITVATADGTTQVLTVTLHGTNDAAIITGSSTAELTETNAVQSTSGNLDATDVDSSNTFVVQTAVAGSNGYGTFSIDNTGAWTYTMDSAHNEFVGGTDYTDSITVATADGTTRELTVTLHGTNDAPVAQAAVAAVAEDASISGSVVATDADAGETATLVYALVGAAPTGLTFNPDGTYSFDASSYDSLNDGEELELTIPFTATDENSTVSNTANLVITITGTNELPVVAVNQGLTVLENSVNTVISTSVLNTIDQESGSGAIIYTLTAATAHGTLTKNGNALAANDTFTQANIEAGAIKYTNSGAESATDGFTFSVSDGHDTVTGQTFSISVTGVNDNGVVGPDDSNTGDDTVAENASIGTHLAINAFASDADFGTSITYSLTDDAGGRFGIDSGTGVVSVAGVLDYESATSHNITVLATSSDGSTGSNTFTIQVTNVNDNPVQGPNDGNAATNSAAENAVAGTTVGITAVASDADIGTTISYLLTDDAGGKFAIDETTGIVTVAGALDYESANTHSITVRANSSDGSFSTQSFSIAITNVNEGPSITSLPSLTIEENFLVAGTITAFDPDAGDHKHFSLVGGADLGRLSINGSTGVLSFLAAPDYENPTDGGADNTYEVDVRVTDGGGLFATQSIVVTVTDDPSEAPVVQNASMTVVEGAANAPIGSGQLYSSDQDTGVALLVYTVSTAPAHGSLSKGGNALGAGGTFTQSEVNNGLIKYSHNGDEVTTDGFTFSVSDGTNTVAGQSFLISVTNVNDPGSVSITGTASENETLTANVFDPEGTGTIGYQWKANGNDIAGTGSTLLLTDAHIDKAISVVVSYTDGKGTTEVLTSAETSLVTNVNDAPTGSVLVSGPAVVGVTLAVGNSLADEDGLGAISYQWKADGIDIGGATGTSFTLTAAQQGKAITATASYTDGHGTAESVTSAATSAVISNIYTGTPNSDSLAGTAADEEFYGLASNDTITGGAGNDLLDGGAGNDSLIGGLGNDTYVLDAAGDKVVEQFNEGIDTILSSVSRTLGDHQENLTLTGAASTAAYGNGLDNILIGNDGNNYLDGKIGADSMSGGKGNDYYWVDDQYDVVIEGANEGTDEVKSTISYTLTANVERLSLLGTSPINGTGNSLNNTIAGNAGNNILDGGIGVDTMRGGTGDDTYIVDNHFDVTSETGGGGTDTVLSSVSRTLATDLENLTLTGAASTAAYGNSLDNILIGNDGNNYLDGMIGADSMSGGKGNDYYWVDDQNDVVIELVNEGTDEVKSTVSYTLTANIERLTLLGTSPVNGTGNSLNNTITGNTGNNVLDGGMGIDTMRGGAGDDTYIVDNTADSLSETGGGGVDTVMASVSRTLGIDFENLTLTGSNAVNGYGSALSNVIIGNSGNNILSGGAGNDTLTGGLGNDTLTGGADQDYLVFDSEPGIGNIDTVVGFVSGVDKLVLENSVFVGLGSPGALDESMLLIGAGLTEAEDAGDRLIYNTVNGALFYDVDGLNGAAALQIATLTGAPTITYTDFLIL
jgi:VCBS repeat-containing protein